MDLLTLTLVLILLLFAVLGSGVWIAMALAFIGLVAMVAKVAAPPGAVLATSFWSASNGWDLTALPMFIWMGEILFRTRLAEDLFHGLAPWLNRLPGRLLHVNVLGLRDLRRGVGLVGGDLRHHRAHFAAGTAASAATTTRWRSARSPVPRRSGC